MGKESAVCRKREELKALAAWCENLISLYKGLSRVKNFSDDVYLIMYGWKPEIQVGEGIEKISQALKVPLHIDVMPKTDNWTPEYPIIKSVTYYGVKFYQLGKAAKTA